MTYFTMYGLALVSGFVPLVNTEACLVSAAVLSPGAQPFGVALAATLGQMTAKGLLYFSGRGLLRLPVRRHSSKVEAIAERLRGRGGALIFVSALTGLPPFYAVSIAAGVLRLAPGSFLLFGLAGRLLRFTAVVLAPRLLEAALP